MAAASKPKDWLPSAMGLACGMWGWSPEDFWKSTPADMNLVLAGLKAARPRGDFDAGDVEDLQALIRKAQEG